MKFLLTFSILLNLAIAGLQRPEKHLTVRSVYVDSTVQHKINAFTVLQNKCNICHNERNRHAVFTYANMNAWSMKINDQVFIKKRMPKGNEIVLTDLDKRILMKRLQSIK